jgi:hypothetical protein
MPKKYKISKKEIEESKVWIDGFQNALKSVERVGTFAKWKPIPDMNKIIKNHGLALGCPVWVISSNGDCSICEIAWWDADIKDWVYTPTNTGLYKTPSHYAEIQRPKNNPITKQYKNIKY